MFRGCCFRYADIYSGDYNLIMAYVNNDYNDFSTGGEYEPVTESIPMSADTLLYGMKYAENPLEFEVEIVNPDSSIPFEQMSEIKEWLFGQDGWKKLYINDFYSGQYHLKCLLIPKEDITDVSGYRGIRCTVKNMSAYWYGEDETITYTKEDIIAIAENPKYLANKENHEYQGDNFLGISDAGNITIYPYFKTQNPVKVMPIIKFKINDNSDSKILEKFQIHNYITRDTGLFGQNQSDFTIKLTADDIGSEWEIDCKYGLVKRYKPQINNSSRAIASDEVGITVQSTTDDYDIVIPELNNNYDLLYVIKGENRIAFTVRDKAETTAESVTKDFLPLEYISFTYTPMYRIGGF